MIWSGDSGGTISILCGHACTRGGILEICDAGYELGVTMDMDFYFYIFIFKFYLHFYGC